jgi:type VI secretion system protein ImpL
MRSFNRAVDFLGGGWVALGIALLLVAFVIFLVFRSGKQIRFRIPFLPASIGTIKIGRGDLEKIKPRSSKLFGWLPGSNKVKAIDNMFYGIDRLSGSVARRYDLPLYVLVTQYADANHLVSDIGDDVLQRLSLKDIDGEEEGSCLVLEQGCVVHHESNNAVIADLIHQRPERPLDGVVLVLSAREMLLSDRAERQKKIHWLHQEFWKIQQKVEFVIPVYLLISDAEHLTGFKDFWSQPEFVEFQDDMWGWSNPYNMDVQFKQEWISEALGQIEKSVRESQLQIASRESSKGDESAMVLANSVESLRQPLIEVARTVLNPSALSHPYMFRGVYLTGRFENKERAKKHQFLSSLFSRKIFAESSMAFPRQAKVLSASARLRWFQLTSIALALILAGWFGINFSSMYRQHLDIEAAIVEVRNIKGQREGFDAIRPLLDIMSRMNASLGYCCGPIPWSIWLPQNEDLTKFFEEEIFYNHVFPVMECRGRQLLLKDVKSQNFDADGRYRGEDYQDWLRELDGRVENYSDLHSLMIDTDNSQTKAATAKKFGDLIYYLFGEQLPESFNNNADLYLDAISNNKYDVKRQGEAICPEAIEQPQDLWNVLLKASEQQVNVVNRKIAAPLQYLEELRSLESFSIEAPELNVLKITRYEEWRDYTRTNLLDESSAGFCQSNELRLSSIASSLNALDGSDYERLEQVDKFSKECRRGIADQLRRDNQAVNTSIYSVIVNDEGRLAPKLTKGSEELFDLIDKAGDFSFASRNWEIVEAKHNEFYWSVDLLNEALSFAEEYKSYAEENFASLYLPEKVASSKQSYLAQAVALSQLQRAMLSTIADSKNRTQGLMPNVRMLTTDKRETELAERVVNFRKAMNPLLSLISNFEQLGFLSAKRSLLQQSQNHAAALLEAVDALYDANRLYKYKEYPNWQAHFYTEALFGIRTEGQLDDYLSAQSKRTRVIAFDYAEPLVVFLTNTGGSFSEHKLLSRWHKTLVEINKQQNKDPTSDAEQLELFFAGQFSGVNLSNCPTEVRAFVSPQGNSIFAERTRDLMERATRHCQSFRADSIEKEYASVASAFNKLLAPYYPFNPADRARSLSPAGLKQFREVYSGRSNGLSERIRVLAWKSPDFDAAKEFINDLDVALGLFDQIVGSVTAKDAPGVEIEPVFNVQFNGNAGADFVDHISRWELETGTDSGTYPGVGKNVFWKPDNPTKLTLQWASGSPYAAKLLKSNSPQKKLVYLADGYWSLLRFVQNNRANIIDEKALLEESVLLGFDADISTAKQGTRLGSTTALLRLTFYGVDPETKQRVAMQFPEVFPSKPPMIRKG